MVKYNLWKYDDLINLMSLAYIFSAEAIIFLTSSIDELKIKMYLKTKKPYLLYFFYVKEEN